MSNMTVNVTMTADEFQEFMNWMKDNTHHKAEMAAKNRELGLMAKKVCWAIEENAKRPGEFEIIDQEHAAELLEMAYNYLA